MHSIRTNLYVLVILAIIPALAIILYSGLEQRQRSIENAQHKVLLLTHTMAEAQQEFTRSVRQMLSTLSLMPEVQRLDRQICKEIFRSVLEKNPNYLNIALTDLNGDVLASGKRLTITNFSDRKHVREVLDGNVFSIGEYIISRIGPKTPAFAFAYPVRDNDNRLKAVLTTAIKLANFSDFHDISNLPDKSFVAVTDHKGIRLFYYPPKEDTNPVGKKIKTQSWERASKGRGSGIFTARGSDNVRRIFSFEQVRFRPKDTPYLYVWAGIPEAYVLKPANADLIRNLLFLISATALSLLISWAIGKKTLLSPIKSLVNLTQEFAQGNLEAKSEHTVMPNELGTLTNAFHNMADALLINQRTLRNSEEKYRRLIQNALVGIYQVTLEGRFLTVNQKMAEIFEYESQDNFLAEVDNIFSLYAHPEEREFILKEIDEKGFVGGKEVEFKTKNGRKIWIELYTTVFVDEKNTIYEGLMHDITDQKKLEDELRQAQKMEAIGTLAGGIAHDFNNILSPILGHSELAMMDLPQDSPIQSNLRYIYESGERARELVKQILTFARRREENRIPLKASLIVKEAVKFLRSTIPSTIDIQTEFTTEQDTVLADPTQMNQIVVNLCTNATHAMREKGGLLVLNLSDEYIGEEDTNQYAGLSPGHYLKLSISDTGPGIAPDIMDKIFEPYFTTKGPGEGTGMGLAVIHGIVNNYNGEIIVESEVGKGTAFHVLLPIIDAEVSPAIAPKFEPTGGKERILCVDDEKSAVDTIQSMLSRLGYEVTARTSSIEALEAFRNNPNKFDLVITDQTMPNMEGSELAKELMNIRPDIPIILCTGYSEQIDERSAKEKGISAFVMKPIVMQQIAQTIRDVLDKK